MTACGQGVAECYAPSSTSTATRRRALLVVAGRRSVLAVLTTGVFKLAPPLHARMLGVCRRLSDKETEQAGLGNGPAAHRRRATGQGLMSGQRMFDCSRTAERRVRRCSPAGAMAPRNRRPVVNRLVEVFQCNNSCLLLGENTAANALGQTGKSWLQAATPRERGRLTQNTCFW